MNTHHVTKQTGIKNMSVSSVFFSSLASYPDLNPVELRLGEIHSMKVLNMEQNLKSDGINTMKNLNYYSKMSSYSVFA